MVQGQEFRIYSLQLGFRAQEPLGVRGYGLGCMCQALRVSG